MIQDAEEGPLPQFELVQRFEKALKAKGLKSQRNQENGPKFSDPNVIHVTLNEED